MKTKLFIASIIVLVLMINLASAIIVDADYVTIYPGEQGKVTIEVENSENFDMEDVSITLILDELPFTVVGSSEKDLDDLDEDDDDKATFTIKASTSIVPGDYNIPYKIKYTNIEEDDRETKEGGFGIRVSAQTNIAFTVETRDNIVGMQGKISLKIINKGLGDVKFVSVQVIPNGYELLSSDNVYVGTVDSDDSDFASFDVYFNTQTPILSAKVEYKDFDNNAKTELVELPIKVYTREEALELGLITKNNSMIYFGVVVVLIIVWFVYRKIKKSQRNKAKGR